MNFKQISAISISVLCVCAVRVSAQQPPNCQAQDALVFTGLVDNDWGNPDNWDPSQTPDSTKVACIPPGETADIVVKYPVQDGDITEAEAKAVYVQSDGANGPGKLIVNIENTLTIFEDSWIDGEVEVHYDSSLIIDGTVTITGNGGVIEGYEDGGLKPFLKTEAFRELTIACDPAGNGTEAECLVVEGPFDIQAELVNDAYVIATDHKTNALNRRDTVLSTNGKSGSGFWIASYDPDASPEPTGGRLVVDVGVTGSATWEVRDHKDAEISIRETLTSAISGDVNIYNGTFMVMENFTTTGDLDLWDKDLTNRIPRACVAEGRIARFNVQP